MNSVVHLYLYGLFKKAADGSRIINISKIRPILRWYIRIPKKYHYKIINELVEIKLLKKLCRDDFEIMEIRNNPLTDSLGNTLWCFL